MDCRNVPKKYRPVPFWSWNEKLQPEETAEQVHAMDEAGIGGFFMHARGGLQTEYLGEEWFDNVTAAVEAAEQTDMYPWAYDENGWPSGFGSGAVNGLGIEYQQKYLRMETELVHEETAICKCGSHYFYYDVNPFYVDTLDAKVIQKFIESTYQPYYERYGNRIAGFFTDEPQISRNGIPWSFVFENTYRERYGENILDHLEELFLPVDDYQRTRVKFWKMVTDLFSEAFMKQIYDWCDQRGLQLTGHLVCEETLLSQLTSNGACMPHYEYFHIPGMDYLGRRFRRHTMTPYQLTSVSEQLGKETVLSETFALCGHNVSFAELKGIYEWQMNAGVNLLCQHLEGYSLRGIRKRDYPPAMYRQQPWWKEYHSFNDAMSRESMIVRDSVSKPDVLVLHPQTTAWTLFDGGTNAGLKEQHEQLVDVLLTLQRRHIQFHFGDETIMERHAYVEDGHLVIGKQRYSTIVDPGCKVLFENTGRLLAQFRAQGGKLIKVEDLDPLDVIDNPEITYKLRHHPQGKIHFFVNSSGNYESAIISVAGKALDIQTGQWKPFSGSHVFEPYGSLLLLETGEKIPAPATVPIALQADSTWKVLSCSDNALTLDKCDYYFDGVLQEKNGFVLNIAERANELGRMVQIRQEYRVKAQYLPEKMYLACETPEKFQISINGRPLKQKVAGWFADKSFIKLDISGYMTPGENLICFECNFVQSDGFYEALQKAKVFESEKNKLAYDMEIEAVYLLGNFGLKTEGTWEELELNASRYIGEFVIKEPTKVLKSSHMEQQGYPFFCGEMVLEGTVNIQGENPVLTFCRRGINVIKVSLLGQERTLIFSDSLPLKELVGDFRGMTTIRLILLNNLRNLLGPHHLQVGESYAVGPGTFFKEPCVWNKMAGTSWNDDYCFVHMGI